MNERITEAELLAMDLRAPAEGRLEATWNWRATWHIARRATIRPGEQGQGPRTPRPRRVSGSSPLLAVIGMAFLSLAPGARAQATDALTVGVLGAAAADLATTQWGYATLPGARDANPLVRGPASAVAVKAGMTAGVLLLDREFQRRGNRRASKVLKIATIVVWGSCAAWNVRQVRRHGR